MSDVREMTDRFEEALAWAAHLHRGQTRKGSDTPYVSHLLAVCALVLEHGGDEEAAIAALLHDAIEDGGGDAVRTEIRARFGADVAALVEGCTDADSIPKPPWRARKERFLERLAQATPRVRLVVAADKLHNAAATLRDLRREGNTVWDRFRGGRDGTLWYYREAVRALRRGWSHGIVDELAEIVERLNGPVRPG